MSAYLDANMLVALFTEDALSDRADLLVRSVSSSIVVSDFTAAELASAVSRKVRMKKLREREAREALADFDVWMARTPRRADLISADVAAATIFIRRLDLSLRTPDAIHIAIAQRLGATLVTMDRRLGADAATLGIKVVGS